MTFQYAHIPVTLSRDTGPDGVGLARAIPADPLPFLEEAFPAGVLRQN